MTGAAAVRARMVNGLTVARLGWLGWASVITAALVLAPIAAVVCNIFLPSEATWSHLVSTVLPEYIWNTLRLIFLVAMGVILFGVTAAWLVTAYRFPGQRVLEWALVLPLAMPAYVMAYAYTDWLQAAGPVQTLLRDLTGWRVREYWFPEIRSLPGAAGMPQWRSANTCVPWKRRAGCRRPSGSVTSAPVRSRRCARRIRTSPGGPASGPSCGSATRRR